MSNIIWSFFVEAFSQEKLQKLKKVLHYFYAYDILKKALKREGCEVEGCRHTVQRCHSV